MLVNVVALALAGLLFWLGDRLDLAGTVANLLSDVLIVGVFTVGVRLWQVCWRRRAEKSDISDHLARVNRLFLGRLGDVEQTRRWSNLRLSEDLSNELEVTMGSDRPFVAWDRWTELANRLLDFSAEDGAADMEPFLMKRIKPRYDEMRRLVEAANTAVDQVRRDPLWMYKEDHSDHAMVVNAVNYSLVAVGEAAQTLLDELRIIGDVLKTAYVP